MRLTQLVEHLDDRRLRCGVCQWRCALGAGETGRCLVRVVHDEGLEVVNDGLISAANITTIEEHRLWHCLPGTRVLAIGGWGYPFPVDQQRSSYARPPDDASQRRQLDADRAANFALQQLCRGVVWAFNDPAVSHEYVRDLLQFSRANSRYTALVSSGYQTIAALDELGPYLDAFNLDLRGFSDIAYTRLAGVDQWRGILEGVAHLRHRWGCHVEVMTRLHPGVNDDSEDFQALAAWLRDALGPYTPWHVLPGDAGSAAAATVARARRIGHEAGLQFIYGPDAHQSTICPSCGAVLIERSESGVRSSGLDGSRCASCGQEAYIRTSIFKR